MIVLGVSAYYHDASAALAIDGEIVGAAAEERHSRIKHDSNFPTMAIACCLEQAGIAAADLDAVVFYEDPSLKFTRVLTSTFAAGLHGLQPFITATGDWVRSKLWVQLRLSRELGVHPMRVRVVRHHDAHLSQAFLTSPFESAALLAVDAVGEWTCTSIGLGDRAARPCVESRWTIEYPHSLGLVYAAFSAYLGFRPNDGEASTMALAAFGRPRFAEEVRRVIRVHADGTYGVDARLFNFLSSDMRLFGREFCRLFGPPRDWRNALPFDALDDHFASAGVSDADRRHADLAASVQLVLEEALVALARRAQRLSGCRRLCFSGGVALNAVANARLLATATEELFIPPDPGDGGAAMGAALLECARLSGAVPRPRVLSPYLGSAFDTSGIEATIAQLDVAEWRGHRLKGSDSDCDSVDAECAQDFDALLDEVVAALESGQIVGWVQGRFELGPRALGNRSILVDPANLDAVRALSEGVKLRARFRPYALSVSEEHASRLVDDAAHRSWGARWMQVVLPVRPEMRPLVRGGLHCDGTTRLQVCGAQDNPRFHRLLNAFGARRGLAALLNTSFNEAGYPIVATPEEALLTFARTDMHLLVLNDLVVRKVNHAATQHISREARTRTADGARHRPVHV